MELKLPESWQKVVGDELEKPYFKNLMAFLEAEKQRYTIYPRESEIFSALEYTPYEIVRLLILGQDPYHGPNQAHGCSFSVRPRVPLPPSLKNIFAELQADVGATPPDHGCLVPWARQGVLLLNTVLTVRAGQANSHQGKGWEQFTDAVFRAVNKRQERVVFILWGNAARRKAELVDTSRHVIIQSAHPSPYSASYGFFGSRPFSRANAALREAGLPEINWQLPNLPR
ncbi:MAG: uracil-DNA glycosylase [Chloroflexi bacterium]|nr:uracil-DNA glycosylase [Chloroflexota bacterium]